MFVSWLDGTGYRMPVTGMRGYRLQGSGCRGLKQLPENGTVEPVT
jgi:hypothetical protein